MRRVLGAILVVVGGAVAAQQTPFRAGVSLVTVDVTVIDKDGKPVPGLTPEDFEIKLGGKPQPVRAIAFVRAAVAASITAPNVPESAPKPAAAIVAKEVEVRRTISNQDVDSAAFTFAAPAVADAASVAKPTQRAHQSEPRVFVILIDDLSFTAQSGRKLFAAAQKFVDTVPASDPVGFTTSSGSATVNPTMDRAVVKRGLAKVVGEFNDPREIRKGDGENGGKDSTIGIDESIDIDRGDDTLLLSVIVRECFGGNRNDPSLIGRSVQEIIAGMGIAPKQSSCASDVASEARRTAALMRQTKARQLAALTGVLNAMRTAAGIRHLVFVTDGMAVSRDVIDLQPVTRVAAAAGVQFSVIMEDPEVISMAQGGRFAGMDSGGSRQADMPSNRVREDNKLLLNGAQTFNDMVGGIFYRVVGDAGPSFARILEASSAVYRLGVEMPAGANPTKELSLGVSVNQPGLTVRANRMAINTPTVAEPTAPGPAMVGKPAEVLHVEGPVPASIDDVLKSALNQNQALRGVPIRLGATVRRSTSVDGQIDVSVNVILPSSAKTPITTLVGLVDETNALRISRRVVDNTTPPVQFLFPVAPGSYAVRFGAAAADGALGTIDVPIAVKLHRMGAFTTSDVLTYIVGDASQKATLFAVDEVPAAAEPSTYYASIELYPTGAMPSEPPLINWTIVRDGDTKAMVDEDSAGRVGKSLFRSDFEIPFASLPPGTYVIRATLIVADTPAGSVGAVIRKK